MEFHLSFACTLWKSEKVFMKSEKVFNMIIYLKSSNFQKWFKGHTVHYGTVKIYDSLSIMEL